MPIRFFALIATVFAVLITPVMFAYAIDVQPLVRDVDRSTENFSTSVSVLNDSVEDRTYSATLFGVSFDALGAISELHPFSYAEDVVMPAQFTLSASSTTDVRIAFNVADMTYDVLALVVRDMSTNGVHESAMSLFFLYDLANDPAQSAFMIEEVTMRRISSDSGEIVATYANTGSGTLFPVAEFSLHDAFGRSLVTTRFPSDAGRVPEGSTRAIAYTFLWSDAFDAWHVGGPTRLTLIVRDAQSGNVRSFSFWIMTLPGKNITWIYGGIACGIGAFFAVRLFLRKRGILSP